jgi:hypothetical protein
MNMRQPTAAGLDAAPCWVVGDACNLKYIIMKRLSGATLGRHHNQSQIMDKVEN